MSLASAGYSESRRGPSCPRSGGLLRGAVAAGLWLLVGCSSDFPGTGDGPYEQGVDPVDAAVGPGWDAAAPHRRDAAIDPRQDAAGSEPDAAIDHHPDGGEDPSVLDGGPGPRADAGRDAGEIDLDAGSDAAAGSGDDAAALDAGADPHPLAGATFVEEPGSFKLEYPTTLRRILDLAVLDTGDVRLLTTKFRGSAHALKVRYGAADLGDSGAVWQDPSRLGTFAIQERGDPPRTFVSEPFDFELHASVPVPFLDDVQVHLEATQARFTASFDESYQRIEHGTLAGVVTRSQAEALPLPLGELCPLLCLEHSYCEGSGVRSLAGLLDCNGQALDADADADGTLDAYRMQIRFQSERID